MTSTHKIRGEEISEKQSQTWAKMRLSLLGEGCMALRMFLSQEDGEVPFY